MRRSKGLLLIWLENKVNLVFVLGEDFEGEFDMLNLAKKQLIFGVTAIHDEIVCQ